MYGKNNRDPETPSQKRIRDTKEFFDKILQNLSFEEIDKIREKIENSLLGIIERSSPQTIGNRMMDGRVEQPLKYSP